MYGCQWKLVPLYLLMMWLLNKTAGWILKCFQAILSAHIQPNASELIGRRFTVQMGQWPKAYCERQPNSFFKAKKWNVYAMAKSIHLTWNLNWAFISLAEDKNWRENAPWKSRNWRQFAVEGLAEHHQGWNAASGDVYAFPRHQAVIGFATKY